VKLNASTSSRGLPELAPPDRRQAIGIGTSRRSGSTSSTAAPRATKRSSRTLIRRRAHGRLYKLDKVGYLWRVVTGDPGDCFAWPASLDHRKVPLPQALRGAGSCDRRRTQIINSGNVRIEESPAQDSVYIRGAPTPRRDR